MIWYAISPAKLRAAIKKVDADWFDDAAAGVAALPDPPKSSDFKPLWSRIKGVYKRVLADRHRAGPPRDEIPHRVAGWLPYQPDAPVLKLRFCSLPRRCRNKSAQGTALGTRERSQSAKPCKGATRERILAAIAGPEPPRRTSGMERKVRAFQGMDHHGIQLPRRCPGRKRNSTDREP